MKSKTDSSSKLPYQVGLGNHFESEALPSSIPQGQNSPQKTPRGLYAEQLTGSSFTAPRSENLRTWQYRVRPSVSHSAEFERYSGNPAWMGSLPLEPTPPTQWRWSPLAIPNRTTDFCDGIFTIAINGDPQTQKGIAVHLYSVNAGMQNRFLYNADGEMLIVPFEGELLIQTELGDLTVAPLEIAVLPRGLRFSVQMRSPHARGYIAENFGAPLRLPHLGPIGANGLANARDFQIPHAHFEDKSGRFEMITKFGGALWASTLQHSPLDVVAWQGNYYPYKYELSRFNTINSVSYDHPDPSIFTVLTSPSDTPGVAGLDFVIFPPRWIVAENTFRPPYFHRNLMSEFMGLIQGTYDAKTEGFVPGGSSIHNCMAAHGPDLETYQKACNEDLKPTRYKDTMAFMFESRYPFQVHGQALKSSLRQKNYLACWKGFPSGLDQG